MLDLQAIRAVALEYRQGEREGEAWTAVASNYQLLAADPDRILLLVDNLEAMGRLARDLAGYIKLAGRDKPDPVRDDLLAQTRQMLNANGL